MRNLVQNRVADFIPFVQKGEMPRQRDPPVRVIAFTEPPPRVIELKSPIQQSMLMDQFAREIDGFVEVHESGTGASPVPGFLLHG
jgi:hypothetical protein